MVPGMLLRRSVITSLLSLSLACGAESERRPAAYPPGSQGGYPAGQYPQGQYPNPQTAQQYPPQQYPPQQYPPQQYPAPAPAYPVPTAPGPVPSAPLPGAQLPALPNVDNDPINALNVTALRQSAQSILVELTRALPDVARSRVEGIPLVVDDTPGDVNAFAACSNGRSLMAVTDGLLEIMAWLAMTAAHDELFGTAKTDEYIRFIAQNLAPGRPIPRPAGLIAPAAQVDGRKVQRQHVLFEEALAFVLGHELAHHHLGHLPCTGKAGPLGSGDLARVLSSQVPLFNQPNEAAADLAGTSNVLDAGARRSGARWSEQGGLLTMRFFIGLDGGVGRNLLLAFQQSHPPPQLRVPLIQQSANFWRSNGGVGIPVPRVGG
jgi:hypothetical protein